MPGKIDSKYSLLAYAESLACHTSNSSPRPCMFSFGKPNPPHRGRNLHLSPSGASKVAARNTKIRNCIIDNNAKTGKDIITMNKQADRPEDGFYIRSGITVILEKATIEDGSVI
ncbi:hypothetical protein VNO77_03788 [Canavalia gladiata]|uniref:Uncharacterized protein n=1 Tax=Canavalia gladiata TaxID=3824 RepID=A0AAN9R755_CANGL